MKAQPVRNGGSPGGARAERVSHPSAGGIVERGLGGGLRLGDTCGVWTSAPRPGAELGHGSRRRCVLVPYSGSRTADGALEVAASWAGALNADAWVLYVRPWDTSRGGHFYLETRAEARVRAQAGVRRLRGYGATASAVVRDADRAKVAQTIVAEAEALDACFIVLGTSARRALGAALVGSTSLAVARRATRPVILVKAAGKKTRRGPRWMHLGLPGAGGT